MNDNLANYIEANWGSSFCSPEAQSTNILKLVCSNLKNQNRKTVRCKKVWTRKSLDGFFKNATSSSAAAKFVVTNMTLTHDGIWVVNLGMIKQKVTQK